MVGIVFVFNMIIQDNMLDSNNFSVVFPFMVTKTLKTVHVELQTGLSCIRCFPVFREANQQTFDGLCFSNFFL